MGLACIITRILLLCLLLFCFSNSTGFGRKLVDMSPRGNHNHVIVTAATELHLVTRGKSREMIQMDYADTGPNFNGRSVYPLPSVPQPPPPPPPPPPQSGY